MKKVLTILLGIALIISLSGAVAGDAAVIPDGNQMTKSTNSGSTMVYYSISEENYVVVIPQSFSFSSGSSGIIGLSNTVGKANLTAKSATLMAEHNLYVNITSEHDFKMVLHEGDPERPIYEHNITYQMEYTNPDDELTILNETTYPTLKAVDEILVLQAPSGVRDYNVPLTFTMTGTPKDIGTFKDKLTFVASIRVA